MPAKQRIKWIMQGGLVVDLPMIAATDLSASGVGRFVSPGSVNGEVILGTGASLPVPLGVLQNSPTAGQPARVRIFGVSTLTACPAACQLIPGTFITSGSLGAACAAGALGIVLGRWLSASVSASTVSGCAFVNCAAFPFFGSACVPGSTS